MSNPGALLVAGTAVAVSGHMLGLDVPLSLGLGAGAVAVGLGVQTFLKLDPSAVAKKTKKKNKKVPAKAVVAPTQPEAPKARSKAKASQEGKLNKSQRAKLKKRLAKEQEAREAKEREEIEKAATELESEQPDEKKKKKKSSKTKNVVPSEEQPQIDPPLTKTQQKKQAKAQRKQRIALENDLNDGAWEQVPITKSKSPKNQDDESKASNQNHSILVEVDPQHFGKILGTGGSTLRKLQEATGTIIDVPKKSNNSKFLKICGDEAACEIVKSAIQQLVAKGYSDVTHENTVGDGIEVPARAHGVVIGPGGANLKALQAKTGTRISVPERGSGNNTVTIRGEQEGVRACRTAIKQLIEEGYSTLTHENWVKIVINVSGESVASLIGQNGKTIRDLQKSTSTRIKVPNGDLGAWVPVTVLGEVTDVNNARNQIAELVRPPAPVPTPPEWSREKTLPSDPWALTT